MYNNEKLRSRLMELAAEFFGREATRQSLVTVTGIDISKDRRRATVLVTVLPESEEAKALDFLRRHRSELYSYVGEHLRGNATPLFDIMLDRGEKSRQGLDKALLADRL